MGPGNWRKGLDIERLLTEMPEQFDFFQAVKIIEQLRRRLGVAESEETSTHQQVKFSSVVSQAFPTTNITEIKIATNDIIFVKLIEHCRPLRLLNHLFESFLP